MVLPDVRVVSVEIAAWEIECCIPPPRIGDAVTWPLVFHPADESEDGDGRRALTDGWWRIERRADGATFAVDGPLVAYWSDLVAPAPGTRHAVGTLSTALHGGTTPVDLPRVAGTVRRLWVLSQVFAPRPEDGPRCWGPVAGTLRRRSVDHSPRRFAMPLGPESGRRSETGLLVELSVGP